MDIGFVLTYIIIPLIVGCGIISGKTRKKYQTTGTMLYFKAIVYFYCAVANIVNYLNDTWAIRYVAGLAIALSIMECCNGFADGIIEIRKNYGN